MKPPTPEKSQLKAALYLRVSTGPQTEGTSLAGQLLACRQKAEQLGAEVVGIFEDVQSGADYADRVQLQAALSQIERGEANTLIIYDMTRYSRDLEHQQLIKKRVLAARARLEFATFDVGDLNSAEAHLSFGVRGVFAEYERLNTRDRTMRGRVNRAKEGVQPQRSMRPYGYDLVTKRDVMERKFSLEQLGHYVIREEEANWVRQIFERFAAGESLNQIRKWLSLEGPPSPREGKQWGASTVRRILTHTIYSGSATYGRLQRTTDEKRLERGLKKVHYRPAPASSLISIEAPALVSMEAFERCQSLMSGNRQLYSGRTQDRWLLTSLLRCPHCGGSMSPRKAKWTGTPEQYKMAFPDGEKPLGQAFKTGASEGGMKVWEYRRLSHEYKCRNSFLPVDKTKRCKGIDVSVFWAESQVTTQVLEMAKNPSRLEEYLVQMAQENSSRGENDTQERERLCAELLVWQGKERNVVALQERALANDLDPSIYDGALKTAVNERKAMQARLDVIEARHHVTSGADARQKAEQIGEVLRYAQRFLGDADDDLFPPHMKNKALLSIISRVEVDLEEGEKTPNIRIVWKED